MKSIFLHFIMVCLFMACGPRPSLTRESLKGKWQFYTFEATEKYKSKEQQKDLEESVSANKNVVLEFGPDSSFKSSYTADAGREYYSLIPEKSLLVMMGDTLKVLRLDDKWLRLYKNKRSPVAVFRKVD